MINYCNFDTLDDQLRLLLLEKYKIDELDVEDVFTNTQLSKIEYHRGYLYVSLQFPAYNKQRQEFVIKEVHSFVTDEFFITINKNNYNHLNEFSQYYLEISQDYESTFNLFYEMMDIFITAQFRAIIKFKKEIKQLEDEIFDFETVDDAIKQILVLKRNLVVFQSIIEPLMETLINLQTRFIKITDQKDIERLDDSLDKLKKIVNNIKTFRDQMQLLRETNEAVVNRSTNEIIKVLTAMSLIVIPPMFVTSFFGMNVYFGWNPDRDWIPVVIAGGLIFISTIGLYLFFRKKKWI
jgi:magnesium transporter